MRLEIFVLCVVLLCGAEAKAKTEKLAKSADRKLNGLGFGSSMDMDSSMGMGMNMGMGMDMNMGMSMGMGSDDVDDAGKLSSLD